MAFRRLLVQASKTSACKTPLNNPCVACEGFDFARPSSGLNATTSGAGLGGEERNAGSAGESEFCFKGQGFRTFGCNAATLGECGASLSCKKGCDGGQRQQTGSQAVQGRHNPLIRQPLSQTGSLKPAPPTPHSFQVRGISSLRLGKTGHPPQSECTPVFQVRHYADAVAAEDTNVDPAVLMHRAQFLRASSRKVVKPQPVIRAYLRDDTGKTPNKKERRQGLVPGIVFSGKDGHRGGNKRLISVGHKQLSAILQPLGKFFFSAMTWDLEVYEGRPGEEATAKKTVERVVPKSVHLHAATDEPMNVTFMRVSPEEKITVDVPLLFIGEDACPGLKKGGRLNTIRRLVRYVCPGDKVPPYLEVDISRLNIGQSIFLKDLPADPALRLVAKDLRMPVLKIMGRTQDEADEGE